MQRGPRGGMSGVWRILVTVFLPDYKVSVPAKKSLLTVVVTGVASAVCTSTPEKWRTVVPVTARSICAIHSFEVCESLVKAVTTTVAESRDACAAFHSLIDAASQLPPQQRNEWVSVVSASFAALHTTALDLVGLAEQLERELLRVE